MNEDHLTATIDNGPRELDHARISQGKVRDIYVTPDDNLLLLTTDRVSAFDQVVGTFPGKGQVLTGISNFWFNEVSDLVPHHILDIPHPNIMVTKKAKPLPIEVIVRGYITGSTSTSLWTLYASGVEKPYGLELPKGLKKHDRLPSPVITPTTKAAPGQHDERLTSDEVVSGGHLDAATWEKVQSISLELFRRGSEVAEKTGLILVDTKYEFGWVDDELTLIDEVHTPDSSRYWTMESYKETQEKGTPPANADKELLRLWLKEAGFVPGEDKLPSDVRMRMANRYEWLYEHLAGIQIQDPVKAKEELAPTLRRLLAS